MRGADISTIARIGLILLVVYLILVVAAPAITILILALAFLLDGVDGFLALREVSKGKITLSKYLNYSLGYKSHAKEIKAFKHKIEQTAKHGPRFDVAADRIAEYSLWSVFTFVGILPLFVLIIVIIRHSLADALLGAKGTSSKMKTGFARAVYASNISRGGVNILKFITFSWLILVFTSGYSLLIGYALTALLLIFILARGAAEIYESVH